MRNSGCVAFFVLCALAVWADWGWYKGDLHCHTTHSDGDSDVAAVVASAEERGLDFLAITDHDTSMRGNPSQWRDPGFRSSRLILLYGVEWTTKLGHANVWSDRPFDYTGLWEAHQDLNARAAVDAAHLQNALFSINHPAAYACCPWEYDVPEDVDCLEVWNASYNIPNNNHRAVRDIWDGLLAKGRRVVAIGGSDSHQLRGIQSNVNLHGTPTTWVYAKEGSGRGILDAILAGHASISYAAFADRVELSADTDGDGRFETMQGDAVPIPEGPITLRVSVHGPDYRERGFLQRKHYTAVIYRNGKVFRRRGLTSGNDSITLEDTPEARTYYRVELRGSPQVGLVQRLLFGDVLGLTNPIYVGYE